MKLIYVILFIQVVSILLPPNSKNNELIGTKRNRGQGQSSILEFTRPIKNTNNSNKKQIQKTKSLPTSSNQSLNRFQLKRANSTPNPPSPNDFIGKPLTKEAVKGVLFKNKNGTVADTFHTIAFKFLKKVSCFINGILDCIKSFYEFIQVNSPKMSDAQGNSGYFSIFNENNKNIDIFQYGRMNILNNHVHSEEELLKIDKKVTRFDYTILLSSYYSPCHNCQQRLLDFLKIRTDLKIYMYYLKNWDDSKEEDLQNLGRLKVFKFKYIPKNKRRKNKKQQKAKNKDMNDDQNLGEENEN